MLSANPSAIVERLARMSAVPLTQAFLLVMYQDSYNLALFTDVCAQCQCPGVLVGNLDGTTSTYFTWMGAPNLRVPCVVVSSTVTANIQASSSNVSTSYAMTPEGADPGWVVLQTSTWLMAVAAALYHALALLATFKGVAFVVDGNGHRLPLRDVPRAQLCIVGLHFVSATADLLTFLNFAAMNSRGFPYRTQVFLSELSNPLNTSATIAMALLLREVSQFGTETVGQRLLRAFVYVLALGLLVGSFAVYIDQMITWRPAGDIALIMGLVAINYLCASIYFICFGYLTTKRILRMKGSLSDDELRRRRRFALRLVSSGVSGLISLLIMVGIAATTVTNGTFATFWTLYGLLAISSAITRILELSAFAPVGQRYMLAQVKDCFVCRYIPLPFTTTVVNVQPAAR